MTAFFGIIKMRTNSGHYTIIIEVKMLGLALLNISLPAVTNLPKGPHPYRIPLYPLASDNIMYLPGSV
mgnify:CR=1 FL=1